MKTKNNNNIESVPGHFCYTNGAVLISLILVILAVALTATPSISRANSTSNTLAKPAATPPDQVLDDDSAMALVEELTAELSDVLEAELVTSITDKWGEMALAGKTYKQAIAMLTAEMKKLVTDAEANKTLADSWSAKATGGDDVEPVTPDVPQLPVKGATRTLFEFPEPLLRGSRAAVSVSPESGLSDESKRKQGATESMFFENVIGQVTDWSAPYKLNYRGQQYTVYKDNDDPDREVKLAGVNQGIKILIDKGINIPANLTFYLAKDLNGTEGAPSFCKDARGAPILVNWPEGGEPTPKCKYGIPMAVAFKRDRNWAPVARIIISSLRDAAEKSISGQRINGLSKIPVTTIHEIGHILHERHAGEFFWTDAFKGLATNQDVSDYATLKGKREFVAEVFTGSVLGLKWFPRVLTEYQSYRGPKLPR